MGRNQFTVIGREEYSRRGRLEQPPANVVEIEQYLWLIASCIGTVQSVYDALYPNSVDNELELIFVEILTTQQSVRCRV